MFRPVNFYAAQGSLPENTGGKSRFAPSALPDLCHRRDPDGTDRASPSFLTGSREVGVLGNRSSGKSGFWEIGALRNRGSAESRLKGNRGSGKLGFWEIGAQEESELWEIGAQGKSGFWETGVQGKPWLWETGAQGESGLWGIGAQGESGLCVLRGSPSISGNMTEAR